ncbi:protein unc-80 homolog isoform X3 [Salvelinus alpinus]|uniref:protein unc-80 homolog isoform X3 n=1 Tax=Salvelinus alpinus TaxID=8036 RepID=UPI0039FC06D1
MPFLPCLSLFVLSSPVPFISFLFHPSQLLTQPADSQEEITARHHIADQLERRFIPRPLCKSSLFAEFNNELKILKEAVHSGSAYQGKTSISTVGTSTSAYRLSLATMSRSNTGTGTVWEQESQPSRQPSQDTLSRTDEDDEQEQEENDSISIPSVVSEHEVFLPRLITQRRFSSHATGSAQPEPSTRSTMLPSHRVASVQSEPGQQNLLNQPPLGRNRGLRQLRRPLLSLPKSEARGPGRSGARLSTTRRSIQPKNRPLETLLDCEATHGWDQKRVVTFTEGQQAQGKSPDPGGANAHPEGRKASPAPPIAPPAAPGASSSATVKADLHSPAKKQLSMESKEKREQWGLRSSLSPRPSISRASTPTPPSSCSPLPPPPLPISRTCSPLPPLPILGIQPPAPPTHLFHPGPSSHQTPESPEDEDTTALLGRNADTLLHISEDNGGTENPLLAPLLSPRRSPALPPRHSHALPPRRSPLPISPVDLDLDESHV